MTEKHFILATAGHVDHGKSTLVKALTGTDPDRLPEEKARGITIDLGFAELNLTAANGDKLHIGIVDVPGHEDFVRNMIAGVGSIDLALLVVAADDGWMPQTEEHLQILEYLGVPRAVIALTKSDLAAADKTEAEIHNRLRGSSFARAPLVRSSVRPGHLTGLASQVVETGVAKLKSAIASQLSAVSPPRDIGKPRLFVDRVFSLRGIGTIVTGTLTGGQFRHGQKIVVQPSNLETRIRSIQTHGLERDVAEPGMRTALNLPDIAADQIRRGAVVTVAELGQPCSTLVVGLEQSPRLTRGRPFKNRSTVYLHHGTSRIGAKILLLENSNTAMLTLASPAFAFLGDRFVLRDPSEQRTIGGGVVLDPNGGKQAQFPGANNPLDRYLKATVAAHGFVHADTLLQKSHFSSEQIADCLRKMNQAGAIMLREGIAADIGSWQHLINRASELIDREHSQRPQERGLDLVRLRTELRIESQDIFNGLVSALLEEDFARIENRIARRSHEPSLPPELAAVVKTIRVALSDRPLDPPGRKDLSSNRNLQQGLRFLIEQGEVIELNSDTVVLRDALEKMQKTACDFIANHGSATASQLRQTIGTSRRFVIPLLEYLDRTGFTQREGDLRKLRKSKSGAVANS